MALHRVRTVLRPDRRHWHAGRLVPPHPSNPGCLELTHIHCKEAWYNDCIHDWRPVSFDIPCKQKTFSRKLTCRYFQCCDRFHCKFILPRPAPRKLQRSNMECRLCFAVVVRRSFLASSVRELIPHRQTEMFAGVAASSMPAVNQFLTRQNFPFTSWTSSLKSSVTRLLNSSTQLKLSDNNSDVRGWAKGDTHTSDICEGFKMKNLKLSRDECNPAKTSRIEDSQIYLTHDISITQHKLDEASFRPVVSGLYP